MDFYNSSPSIRSCNTYVIVILIQLNLLLQGLFVPFACVGSSDPVRVLCL